LLRAQLPASPVSPSGCLGLGAQPRTERPLAVEFRVTRLSHPLLPQHTLSGCCLWGFVYDCLVVALP
jgi:hypothetical protein